MVSHVGTSTPSLFMFIHTMMVHNVNNTQHNYRKKKKEENSRQHNYLCSGIKTL